MTREMVQGGTMESKLKLYVTAIVAVIAIVAIVTFAKNRFEAGHALNNDITGQAFKIVTRIQTRAPEEKVSNANAMWNGYSGSQNNPLSGSGIGAGYAPHQMNNIASRTRYSATDDISGRRQLTDDPTGDF